MGYQGVFMLVCNCILFYQFVSQWLSDNPDLIVYFAKGGFKGLNGFYTGGVIEGAYHYGLFGDES